MAQTQLKVFFDLDGTLIDVSERHHRVYVESLATFDGIPLSLEVYWDLKRHKTAWPEILKKSYISPNLVDDFLNVFINNIERTDYLKIDTLFNNATTVLSDVSAQHDCYLVSLRRNTKNLFEEAAWLGLNKYFKKILSGHSETDGYDKKIELISKELGGSKSAVIIGDTEADIITGKKLGIRTVAVLSGIRDKNYLSNLKPDFIVNEIGSISDDVSNELFG